MTRWSIYEWRHHNMNCKVGGTLADAPTSSEAITVAFGLEATVITGCSAIEADFCAVRHATKREDGAMFFWKRK